MKKNNVRREVTNFKIFSPNKNNLLRTLNSHIDQNHQQNLKDTNRLDLKWQSSRAKVCITFYTHRHPYKTTPPFIYFFPNPSLLTFFDIIVPMKYWINTKINSWGEFISLCFQKTTKNFYKQCQAEIIKISGIKRR